MLLASSLFSIFLFSFVVGFGAVISPGPVSTAIVSQAPRQGWLVGPLVASGHAVLELLIVVLIAVGLGAGLASPGIQTLIALLGGALLIWMGASMAWGAWRRKIRLPGPQDDLENMSRSRLVGLGMLATVSNPFWYAWWMTVAAGYLAQAGASGPAAVGAFYLGHVSADYTWDTLLSSMVAGGRRWMNDAVYRAILLACGAFFIYLGCVFLAQGARAF
ncbi:MAG: LysE family transporter [Anaerolineales bacterium]|nr:LysE family transporter [Anaerolineales bacterium]